MDPKRILTLTADDLEVEIRRHNRLYWEDDAPAISDELYDTLVERLKRLNPNSELITQIGAAPSVEPGAKVVHDHPMLSLDKCYSEAELLKWFGTFEGEALVTHKIDGVAMSIRYGADGTLELGATRGNGRVGENVTENIRFVHNVPARVDRPLEVRGEVYMPLSVFRSRYAERFANPRNLCAGAIKQKDAAKTGSYDLHFFAYDALGLDDVGTETEKREVLRSLGFAPAPGTTTDAAGAQTAFDELTGQRSGDADTDGPASPESLGLPRGRNDFETDGIVYKVNNSTLHEAMGLTSHHPRYAIAYKYQGESGFSALEAIEWSVSRSGSINPVAHISPISLSGVTVTRVSLHNLSIIEALGDTSLSVGANHESDLSPGARILVTRRGGVIPHIEAVTEPGDGSLHVPDECPSCGSPTHREADFLHAAHDPECVVQRVRALEHFVKVFDIQGFGPKILEQLWDSELVRTPAQIFELTSTDLAALERLGRKSADNLVAAAQDKRNVELATFLAAWGIPDLGTTVSRYVHDAFAEAPNIVARTTIQSPLEETAGTDAGQLSLLGGPPADTTPELSDNASAAERGAFLLAEVRRAPAETFAEIPGIGPIVSQKIVDGLATLSDEIDAVLRRVTILVDAPKPAIDPSETPLAGAGFLFTGAMEQLGRKEAQELVRSYGGTTPSGVSASLDYLVLGDKDHPRYLGGWRSSKLKKAEKLIEAGSALRIISESEFLATIGEESK